MRDKISKSDIEIDELKQALKTSMETGILQDPNFLKILTSLKNKELDLENTKLKEIVDNMPAEIVQYFVHKAIYMEYLLDEILSIDAEEAEDITLLDKINKLDEDKALNIVQNFNKITGKNGATTEYNSKTMLKKMNNNSQQMTQLLENVFPDLLNKWHNNSQHNK